MTISRVDRENASIINNRDERGGLFGAFERGLIEQGVEGGVAGIDTGGDVQGQERGLARRAAGLEKVRERVIVLGSEEEGGWRVRDSSDGLKEQ